MSALRRTRYWNLSALRWTKAWEFGTWCHRQIAACYPFLRLSCPHSSTWSHSVASQRTSHRLLLRVAARPASFHLRERSLTQRELRLHSTALEALVSIWRRQPCPEPAQIQLRYPGLSALAPRMSLSDGPRHRGGAGCDGGRPSLCWQERISGCDGLQLTHRNHFLRQVVLLEAGRGRGQARLPESELSDASLCPGR